jgi:putative FmdB family regulatory protein
VPTYEYRCSSCGERLEIVHSIHGGPPETCPSCGARDTLRKSFAPPAIVFKGSGWAKKERSSRSAPPASGEATKSGDGSSGDGSSRDAGAAKDAAPSGTGAGTGREGTKADRSTG